MSQRITYMPDSCSVQEENVISVDLVVWLGESGSREYKSEAGAASSHL